jgi:hypothetical protein
VSRDFGKFTKIVKKRDMSDHHASQTRARLLNSRVKSRLLPRYELMGSKGDKVDEKCFVFSVIASRTPSLFSPEGERETKIQQVCQNTPNGRYHAPDFSFKNAKLRLNIIIIITSSFVNVFIAFNHLYSSVIRTCRGKNGGFVPNAKPQIAKAKKPNPKLSKCE